MGSPATLPDPSPGTNLDTKLQQNPITKILQGPVNLSVVSGPLSTHDGKAMTIPLDCNDSDHSSYYSDENDTTDLLHSIIEEKCNALEGVAPPALPIDSVDSGKSSVAAEPPGTPPNVVTNAINPCQPNSPQIPHIAAIAAAIECNNNNIDPGNDNDNNDDPGNDSDNNDDDDKVTAAKDLSFGLDTTDDADDSAISFHAPSSPPQGTHAVHVHQAEPVQVVARFSNSNQPATIHDHGQDTTCASGVSVASDAPSSSLAARMTSPYTYHPGVYPIATPGTTAAMPIYPTQYIPMQYVAGAYSAVPYQPTIVQSHPGMPAMSQQPIFTHHPHHQQQPQSQQQQQTMQSPTVSSPPSSRHRHHSPSSTSNDSGHSGTPTTQRYSVSELQYHYHLQQYQNMMQYMASFGFSPSPDATMVQQLQQVPYGSPLTHLQHPHHHHHQQQQGYYSPPHHHRRHHQQTTSCSMGYGSSSSDGVNTGARDDCSRSPPGGRRGTKHGTMTGYSVIDNHRGGGPSHASMRNNALCTLIEGLDLEDPLGAEAFFHASERAAKMVTGVVHVRGHALGGKAVPGHADQAPSNDGDDGDGGNNKNKDDNKSDLLGESYTVLDELKTRQPGDESYTVLDELKTRQPGDESYTVLDELKTRQPGDLDNTTLHDVLGHLLVLCQDQIGSRVIQSALDNPASSERDIAAAFEELKPHLEELMSDPFGNYVVQRFLDLPDTGIHAAVAAALYGIVLEYSLHVYGCRVVQKILQVLPQDARRTIAQEIQSHTLRCAADHHANHVVQACIQYVTPSNHIAGMMDAIAENAMAMAVHPYGCRLVQRVLVHCSMENTRKKVLDTLLPRVLDLAQDEYGNYVVQHLLVQGAETAREDALAQLVPRVFALSRHKFASNVIEKCLQAPSRDLRDRMLRALLAPPPAPAKGKRGGSPITKPPTNHVVALAKDQYGNYVVQRALMVAEEEEQAALLEMLKPFVDVLKRTMYGKHIAGVVNRLSNGKPAAAVEC